MTMPHTRSLLPVAFALALAACAASEPGPPVLRGYVNARRRRWPQPEMGC
jgi:hypothetical protein